jgi:hypothetical protein
MALSTWRRSAAYHPSVLWALGSASALVYLLAFALPYWLPKYYLGVHDEIYQFAAREPWRGVLFYVALALLFGFYLAAHRWLTHSRQRPISPWAIGLWATVFCLVLIPSQPITSSDVYGYVFQGRIVAVLGQNPFAHLYKDFAGDPFYFCVTFHNLPASTGYGPLWIAITGGLGWLARGRLLLNLFLFKGLAAGLHLLSSLFVYAALGRAEPHKRLAGMLFYAWNPILLYELVGNAHNDAAMAAFGLLGFCLLGLAWRRPHRSPGVVGSIDTESFLATGGWRSANGWRLLAIPFLAAAALVKPVAVLWLPLVAAWLVAEGRDWPARIGRATTIVVLSVASAVVAYAPFWAGPITFQGLSAQSNIHGNSLPNLLIQALSGIWPTYSAEVVAGVKLLTILVFVPFYAWQLRRVWLAARRDGHLNDRGQSSAWPSLVRACLDVMLFYVLLVGFQFWPWYLTWLVAPAALLEEPSRDLRLTSTVVLCLLAPLLYFPFGWQWAREQFSSWGLALLTSLPMMAPFLWLLMHKRCVRHTVR